MGATFDFEAGVLAASEADLDNGFADAADLEVDGLEQAGAVEPEPELSFDERKQVLEDAVCRHPLNREVLYKILVLCQSEQTLASIEENVAAFPEFKRCTRSQHELVRVLEQSFGLSRIDRDEQGVEVDAARCEGLSEDEIDDLIASTGYVVTPEGTAIVRQHAPSARIAELIAKHPAQSEITIDLLRYVNEAPRTYLEVDKLLKGNEALVTLVDGRRSVMQPSVIVDRLCRAGAIEWNEGWRATEAGERFLEQQPPA